MKIDKKEFSILQPYISASDHRALRWWWRLMNLSPKGRIIIYQLLCEIKIANIVRLRHCISTFLHVVATLVLHPRGNMLSVVRVMILGWKNHYQLHLEGEQVSRVPNRLSRIVMGSEVANYPWPNGAAPVNQFRYTEELIAYLEQSGKTTMRLSQPMTIPRLPDQRVWWVTDYDELMRIENAIRQRCLSKRHLVMERKRKRFMNCLIEWLLLNTEKKGQSELKFRMLKIEVGLFSSSIRDLR